MTLKTTRWDVTEHLDSDEKIASFIAAAREEEADDPWLLASLLDDMARAIGMNEIARLAGLPREALYRALDSDHEKPTVDEILAAVSERLARKDAPPEPKVTDRPRRRA